MVTSIGSDYTGSFSSQNSAGSVAPKLSGSVVTGMEIDPVTYANSNYLSDYAKTIFHPMVLTSFALGTGYSNFNFETYQKEINFFAGIDPSMVRLSVTGNMGNASLVINIDSLNINYTIDNFETGKAITGFGVYDSSMHNSVKSATASSLIDMGAGKFSGFYEGGNFSNPSSVANTYLYYLQKIGFSNGVSYDMTGTLTFSGTDNSDSVYGLNTRADILYGLNGDDTVQGYGGDDVLDGGSGNDSLYGNTGNDTYVFNLSSWLDKVVEGGGTDII